jgi:hypothetical protein
MVQRHTISEVALQPFKMLANYPLLLKSILAFEEEGTQEHDDLEKACSVICDTLNEINDKKRQSEEAQMLFDTLKRIKYLPEDTMSSHLKLLQVCEVTHQYAKNLPTGEKILQHVPVLLLLFQDILVAVKPVKKSVVTTSQYKYSLSLKKLEGHKLYYMYHLSYSDVTNLTKSCTLSQLSEHAALQLDFAVNVEKLCSRVHKSHDGQLAEQDLAMVVRPEASKVSLAMSSAKLTLVTNFGKMSLATKKKKNTIATFLSSKMNLARRSKLDPVDASVASERSAGTLLSASRMSVSSTNSRDTSLISPEARSLASMNCQNLSQWSFQHDPNRRSHFITYIFKHADEYTFAANMFSCHADKLFG